MELLPPLPHSMGKSQPEQHASYSLARDARRQQQEAEPASGMKPKAFLANEPDISSFRKDANI